MASLSSWALRGGGESPDYLCFTAEEEGSTVKLQKIGSPTAVSLQIYIDGTSWSDYVFGTAIFLAHAGDKVYFRNAADEVTGFSTKDGQYQFSMSGKISASGNVMSLVDKTCTATIIPNDYCFSHLFSSCTALTTAPELPATTLASSCYKSMFSGCTVLTTAPELPATTLASSCYESMFNRCTALTTAPELPATTLAKYCYYFMFHGCSALTTAPTLPATTLASNCYWYMFSGCTALTSAPELPATTLAESCYNRMFCGCTALTTAPELPATTLASNCYQAMFSGCTALTTAPELPATTLAESCYNWLFSDCTALTTAPELPATTLANGCYESMFEGCSALTTAPELPATTLAESCYRWMFCGCTALNYIKVAFTEWGSNMETGYWLFDVSSTGAFVCPEGLSKENTGDSGIPEGWTVLRNFLCFTAEEAGSTVSLIKVGSPWGGGTLYYSTDNLVSWNKFTPGSAAFNVEPTVVILPKVGDKVYIRCTDTSSVPFFSKDVSNYFHFSLTGKVAASGSVMSLVNTSNLAMDIPSVTSYYFYRLFEGCTALTSAPELPATTLAKGCYDSMFSGCTNLTTVPELPATTLAEGCYSGMFSDCTNLTTSLEISSVGWASLYENLPLKVPEGVEVYYASAISGSTITFTQIPKGTVMAPGTAVIVKGTGTVLFPVSGEEGTSYPDNYLTGTTVSKAYDKDTDPVVYTLSGINSEAKLQFSKYTGTTLGAHKAYLPASALPSGSEAKDFTFVFDDGTSTGITTAPALSPAHEKRYNLNGVPVDEHYKGLIIKNGKKMWSK